MTNCGQALVHSTGQSSRMALHPAGQVQGKREPALSSVNLLTPCTIAVSGPRSLDDTSTEWGTNRGGPPIRGSHFSLSGWSRRPGRQRARSLSSPETLLVTEAGPITGVDTESLGGVDTL